MDLPRSLGLNLRSRDHRNHEMQSCRWLHERYFNDDMQMKVSNRQVMHVFSPVALSFPVTFQPASLSFCFLLVAFYYQASFSISFGLTSRQTETRDICVPCFCMALKECMQRRILEYRCNINQEKALLFSDQPNYMFELLLIGDVVGLQVQHFALVSNMISTLTCDIRQHSLSFTCFPKNKMCLL